MKTYPGAFIPTGRTQLCHRRPLNVEKFWFGVCYYPEHWDPATREGDAKMMAKAGVNVVRMAEFAWDLMEPGEGRFDFSLFDETISRLAGHGISTVLCTPTAAPPRWLTFAHPEILRTDANGVRMQHGSRQHASYAHPVFREHSARITRAMAEHYRDNPHVVGWQTDNEIYCHFHDDHGPEMQVAFCEFLRRKFRSDIGALNRAWGTAFWAQTYGSFEQIETPRPGRPTYCNPAHLLDYARFLSDVVENFQHDQVAILRPLNPRWYVFHNGIMPKTDYRGPFTQDLDFIGFDIYPFFSHEPATRAASHAFNSDRARSYSGNFIVPEHQSGMGSQANYGQNLPEPGEMRKLTFASIARGADSLLYFRWRTCRFGAELYWMGILDHDNVPRRRFGELGQIGREIAAIGPRVLGTSVYLDVAVATGDYDQREAHDIFSIGLPRPDSIAEGIHRVFWEGGYAVGAVHPNDDLSGIKVYFIPHWAYFDPAWVPNLERFVAAGGILVIGARTATRDTNNNVVAETLPGCLRGLVGATVEEYGMENPEGGRVKKITIGEASVQGATWSEWLEPDAGTGVAGRWYGRHFTGKAAVTVKSSGKGGVYYVGTYLSPEVIQALMPELTRKSGLQKLWPAPGGVEVVKRHSTDRQLWFFINHADQEIILDSVPEGIELASREAVGKSGMRLPRHGVCVIERKADLLGKSNNE